MFLQRFLRHLKEQNWIAITLEFIVVVSGVVLGIQLDAWKTGLERDKEFELAVVRLETETHKNIAAVRTIYTEIEAVIPTVTAGLDALRQCDGTPKEIETLLAAVDTTLATRGIKLYHKALEAMTGSEYHLVRLSERSRSHLMEYEFFLEFIQWEANHLEMTPFNIRAWASESISVGAARYDEPFQFSGKEYPLQWRDALLSGAFQAACTDETLFNGLRIYELYQGALPVFLRHAESEMLEFLETLDEIKTSST